MIPSLTSGFTCNVFPIESVVGLVFTVEANKSEVRGVSQANNGFIATRGVLLSLLDEAQLVTIWQ